MAFHRWTAPAAAALLGIVAWASAPAETDPRARALCAEAGAVTRELTEISGMKAHRAVPCDFVTKEQVNAFLKKRIKKAARPEEIRAEELTLKMFGLAPPDFNLETTTVDLLTEQAAAFYDYDEKKLFITDTTPSDTEEPVLAHELSHALADQNFNLAKFIREGRKSDDGSAARMAVMEGQATWLMSEYLARKMGRSLKDSPELAAAMGSLSEAAGRYPIFENSPLYLRMTLVFPYTKGMLFQNALEQKDGQASFGEVFRRPPVSTQQILHPDKYISSLAPTQPALPDPHLPRGYKALVGGTMGELDHNILIEQFADKEQAAAIAPHWRGCTFELRENKKEGRVALLYAVEWDSEEAARRYFAFYKQAVRKKWKDASFQSEGPDDASGTGGGGRFELRRTGAVFTSMEGLAP